MSNFIIVFLSHNKNLYNSSITHFKRLINDPFIECDFRYKIILNLDLVNRLDHELFIVPLLYYFTQNLSIFTTYRIMACQNLLQHFHDYLDKDKINHIYAILWFCIRYRIRL